MSTRNGPGKQGIGASMAYLRTGNDWDAYGVADVRLIGDAFRGPQAARGRQVTMYIPGNYLATVAVNCLAEAMVRAEQRGATDGGEAVLSKAVEVVRERVSRQRMDAWSRQRAAERGRWDAAEPEGAGPEGAGR